MIYDDDTGRRAEFEIRTEDHGDDRPATHSEQVRLPTKELQDQIAVWARQPGWGVERIYALLRQRRHDVTKATIRHIISRNRVNQIGAPRPTETTSPAEATEIHHIGDDSYPGIT